MTERHVLSFPHPQGRFNYRVAAVIIADGHVLVCREDDDAYCMLPGGRVELGEHSRISLAREVEEELALQAEVGAMIATSESFYRRDDEDFHELGFFYAVTLPGHGPDGRSPWLKRRDEGHDLSFFWVPVEGTALEDLNLLPAWLPAFLRNLPEQQIHHVHDERR
ncbi:NUDIX domain-containing protein [Devosia crocina]|uniref:NUDIX domain-containing protein n=1 Tax=Devosia crocina TaxID=429728 RepID=A0A1I7MXL7_9HYPH|nr:NUDIX domain-containing protein [Devosia crocina]SFV27076.1 NUDIX domain-containing protein [Devosia crocina]